MVSIDKSLLKEEAPTFSADFAHPLSCETMTFFKSARHSSRLETALTVDSAVGICAVMCHT